jgi:hypothetical protein
MDTERAPQHHSAATRTQEAEQKPAAETVETSAEQSATVVTPAFLGPNGPPPHPTARSLQRAALLQEQRRHGNRYVAGLVAQREDAPPSEAPPAAEPAGAPTGLIVDDGVEPGPGQMRKREFLAQLRSTVAAAAASELAGTPWADEADPEIDRQLASYEALAPAALERTLRQQLPGGAAINNAADFFPQAADLVRTTIRKELPASEVAGDIQSIVTGAASAVSRAASGAARAVSAVASGVGAGLAALGRALFKRRPGASPEPTRPILRAELGEGEPLAGGIQSTFGTAMGHDFSGVRVHTDSRAASMVGGLNARAATLGEDVAFAAGEYQPGTPVGDALIAHELAHVVQQHGASGADPQLKANTETDELEEEADRAAVGAVVALHGLDRPGQTAIAQPLMPRLKAGLKLQLGSCFSSTRASSALLDSFRRDFSAAAGLIDRSPAAQRIVRDAEATGALYGGFAEDGPGHGPWAYTNGHSVYIPRARTDPVQAMSDFLFELNNAIRHPQFQETDRRAAAGTMTARDYARRNVELEVEGMLNLGEAWFEIKRAAGDASWDRYDRENYLHIYQDYRAGRKTKDQIVTEVLTWQNGLDRTKTNEEYYMAMHARLSGGP